MSEIIYVYGTLRPGEGELFKVKGLLYDMGWYPAILLGGSKDVICEKIVVNDIARVDAYEGYSHSYPEESLYIREPHLDGWIYRYNQKLSFANRIIRSGDYLLYTQTKRGINAGKFSNN